MYIILVENTIPHLISAYLLLISIMIKISPQLRMNVQKVAVITFFYVLINLFTAFFNKTLLNSPFSLGASEMFIFQNHLLLNLLAGFVAGILGGTMLVIVNSKIFRRKSFGFALLVTAISYVLIFFFLFLFVSPNLP